MLGCLANCHQKFASKRILSSIRPLRVSNTIYNLKPTRIPSQSRAFISTPSPVSAKSIHKMTTCCPFSTGAAATGTATETEHVETVVLKPKTEHVEIFRKDYRPPDYDVESVFLNFQLEEHWTKVGAELVLRRKPKTAAGNLVLNGDELKCVSVEVDGHKLQNVPVSGYTLDVDGNLTIPAKFLPPDDSRSFNVKTLVEVNVKENTQLMGLYNSSGIFCTQCEPHGFRRITYFLDRPDVLTKYKVRIEANKATCPVLLSNGNRVASGDLGHRHFAEFVDPFPKPSYLFALVAGALYSISETFTTMSNREVLVSLYCDPSECSKLQWALESVIKAMKWDEENYGREYDLDEFHVVCVRDFNFGAMENKGLNIFNSALLLAHTSTTTDSEFIRIRSVVGHEYFHNWTGNRITCRDWFQLTLKEGLTVFREAQFRGDQSNHLITRILDVKGLMASQFAEDASPMSHPIRPESYISMDNFYTSTVYDKGAEVIGMYETLLGKEGFKKGMDLYFKRHDGQAVTCDDFRAAMADANGRDLTQFERWYSQSGTPQVHVLSGERLQDGSGKYVLKLKQFTPPTPGQEFKKPFHIPLLVGFVGKTSGKDLAGGTQLLELTEEEQTFEVQGVTEDCVLSLNRNFSAPVLVKYEQPVDDLLFLMANDSDGFNRWHATQLLVQKIVLSYADNGCVDEKLLESFLQSFGQVLLNPDLSHHEKAVCIQAPHVEVVAAQLELYNPVHLYNAVESFKHAVFVKFKSQLEDLYKSLALGPGEVDTLEVDDMGRRQLRNTLLAYLVSLGDAYSQNVALEHYKASKFMTDKYSSFCHLMQMDFAEKDEVVQEFYDSSNGDAEVVDKWFAAQACSNLPGTLERVKELVNHPAFSRKTPNRFRSLVCAFTRSVNFHDESGSGYKFLADECMTVDKLNPPLSSRSAKVLANFKKIKEPQRSLMVQELRRISAFKEASPNLYEIVQKSVATE